MRRIAPMIAVSFVGAMLAGCTTVREALQPIYVPQPIEISNQSQYMSDRKECETYAMEIYKPQFDGASVLAAGAAGAGNNAPGAVVGGPLVVAIGAAGGATAAAATGLDVFSDARPNVYRNCLIERTHRDHSALMADPR